MTGFRYSVVRFMPDPTRQEFMNVGVVVAQDSHGPLVRLASAAESISRAKCLGYSGGFDFLDAIKSDVLGWGTNATSALAMASHEWGGTVRFSEVRGVLHDDPAALCDDLYQRYVESPSTRALRSPHVRDRNFARRMVRDSLRSYLPKDVVKASTAVAGRVESHKFDAAVQNGSLLHAVSALSFEIKTERLLAAEVDACAWGISDVRDAQPNLPITVVTLGRTQRKLLARAEAIYTSLGARVVGETNLDQWALGIEAQVRPHLRQTASPHN